MTNGIDKDIKFITSLKTTVSDSLNNCGTRTGRFPAMCPD